MTKVKHVVSAVCVQLIVSDATAGVKGEFSYVQTFLIYSNTTFAEIKKSACEYWQRIDEKYILTDESYNNLVSFEGTVMDFFRIYVPMNSEQEAIVYLISAN